MTDPDDSGPLAADLAAYVDRETFGRIPNAVCDHAKYLVLDSIGVIVGAARLEQGRRMIDFLAEQGGVAEASVPTAGRKLPALAAADANGYLANLLNFDDTYSSRAIGHPGATVVPAALAVAEREAVDGETFLAAVVTGYETSLRVGDAIAPTPERGEDVLGMNTWQIFGAVSPTVKLLGSDRGEIVDALGLAGVTAPVPSFRKLGFEADGWHWLKNNMGWTAMGGVKAGLLADRGFRGNETIFDGDRGFWRMAGSDRFDPALLADGLGETYLIAEVSFKPYPSGKWVQASLDAVRDLTDEVDDVGDIDTILVETFDEVTDETTYPDSPLDVPTSVPYLVSVLLHGVPVGFEWLAPERIDDPEVRALADRVRVVEDSEMTERYHEHGQISAAVTVVLDDGTEHRATTSNPRGGAENPLPPEEIESKFLGLAGPVLGDATARELRDRVLAIEDEPSVSPVAELLSGG